MAGASTQAVLTALLANIGIGIAKLVGALVSGSASMFAEAIHSFVDCSNQCLLLFGKRSATKPPDETHPLGYGREHFFWSFIVAVLLFSLGGLFAIHEGWKKLYEPHEVSSPWMGLSIFAFGFLLEAFALRTCLQEIRHQNKFGSLPKWFRKTTSSDLLVLFTEDSAALLGLAIAAFFLLISWLTGNSAWDAVGSIVVGSLLVVVAVFLGLEIKSLLIGEAPSFDYKLQISQFVTEAIPGGTLLRLIAIQLSGNEVMVSYKVSRGSIEGAQELIDAINALERRVRERFPEICWQFVEPDDHA